MLVLGLELSTSIWFSYVLNKQHVLFEIKVEDSKLLYHNTT